MIQKMGIMGNIFRYLPNSIYGYDIAVKDALSAILRYGTFQSLSPTKPSALARA